ncbi:hypothetical protein LRE75_36640 [Streptomyces sp. 372A]
MSASLRAAGDAAFRGHLVGRELDNVRNQRIQLRARISELQQHPYFGGDGLDDLHAQERDLERRERDHVPARDLTLENVRDSARDIAVRLQRLHDSISNDGLAPGLVPKIDLARERVRDVEGATDLDVALPLVRNLERDLDGASALAANSERRVRRELANAILRIRILRDGLGSARERASVRARELVVELALGLDLARAGDLAAVALAVEHASDLAQALDLADDPGLGHSLYDDLIEARANLQSAATDFIGADLSSADPAGVHLAGIKWDGNTRWPTPEWAARIRAASVETHPGSGVFVVRSEGGHVFTGSTSLTPIS